MQSIGKTAARKFGLWRAFVALAALLLSAQAGGGTLTRAQLEAMFAPLLTVGEKNANLPVWPIFRRGGDAPVLQAYAFETIDIEPVSGYGGKPINVLVVMDKNGAFLQETPSSLADTLQRRFLMKTMTRIEQALATADRPRNMSTRYSRHP